MQHAGEAFLSVLLLGLFGCAGPAHAETTLNFLASPEFGRGLGIGFEFGKVDCLTLGAGAAASVGYLSGQGFEAFLQPGIAVGYRRYLGNWYIGPSLGIGSRPLTTLDRRDHPSASAVLDAGYRWQWKRQPGWSTKVGLGGGVTWWPGHDFSPILPLTVSLGFGL
ncbi:MAG: hypothetical protein JXB39_05180 [Deltaproteobacteria bacterium]|nr:hypothetical protein [Deltaproteobacteria bacterium]